MVYLTSDFLIIFFLFKKCVWTLADSEWRAAAPGPSSCRASKTTLAGWVLTSSVCAWTHAGWVKNVVSMSRNCTVYGNLCQYTDLTEERNSQSFQKQKINQ